MSIKKYIKNINEKLVDVNSSLNTQKLTTSQLIIFIAFIAVSIIIKIILIQFNQTDGEAVTRVWNAFWWCEHPFFVLPLSGHPLWFYVMGPITYVFNDIYLVPIYTMILMMTISGIYIFKITYLLSDFRGALVSYCIFTITPVLFWFNFSPFTYQFLPFLYIIMIYYFILAVHSLKYKYWIISGIFAFLAICLRPEALVVILPFCILAYLLKRKGTYSFIILALCFQIIWWLYSIYLYTSPFAPTAAGISYGVINGSNLGLRLRGFFLPYFFLIVGMTFIIFYFFLKGLGKIYRAYPKYIFISLIIPMIMPAIANSITSLYATFTHSVFYIISMYFFAAVFSAIGLNIFLNKFNRNYVKIVLASIIILSAIPLAYIKDVLPERFKTLYPKVIQPLMTTEFPKETRLLFDFVELNKTGYPALIYDFEGYKESNELCVVYRSKLLPPYNALVTTYNVPTNERGLIEELKKFLQKNSNGMIIVKNKKTLLNTIINDNNDIISLNLKLKSILHSEHFTAYLYSLNN